MADTRTSTRTPDEPGTRTPDEPGTPTPARIRSPRFLVPIVAAALVAILIGVFVGPQHQVVGPQTAGDEELAGRTRDLVDGTGGFRALTVAEVTADQVTWAGLGNSGPGRDGPPPGADAVFETGSVAKTFVAALFADAIERGEVSPDDALEQHLPALTGTEAGSVTLASLAQHSSGLPPLGASAANSTSGLTGGNPYADRSTEQLIADAAEATLNPDQPPTYSNFGISLLGTALAETAGTDYRTLLAERITEPLGMTNTWIPDETRPIPDDAVRGFTFNGTPAPRWPGDGYAPAGVLTLTTITDMAIWAQAQLDGTAPGGEARTATAPFDDRTQIGWAWFTTVLPTGDEPSTMVWHNGMTGGHRAMLAIDVEQERAVVVLGNAATDVDSIAMGLLYDSPVVGQTITVTLMLWAIVAIAVTFSVMALWWALRARSALSSIAMLLISVAGLMLLWNSGPWHSVGGWLWGLALAPTLAAIPVLALRTVLVPTGTTAVPLRPTGSAQVPWLGVALGALLIIGVAQLW